LLNCFWVLKYAWLLQKYLPQANRMHGRIVQANNIIDAHMGNNQQAKPAMLQNKFIQHIGSTAKFTAQIFYTTTITFTHKCQKGYDRYNWLL